MLDRFEPLVFLYEDDQLINYIRFRTKSGSRSLIASKPQLIYLLNYLKHESVDAQTVVIEPEYIERNYLDDFAEYYVRCFNAHDRYCARVHFFSRKFSKSEFTDGVVNKNSRFLKELQESYLGYIVIRPIPDTFLAKICLIPHKHQEAKNYTLITQSNSVSLFGVALFVNTIPLLEQDKVVAACATSAIWTAMNAAAHISRDRMPSPSAITRAAAPNDAEGAKTYSKLNLTPDEIERAVGAFGLSATSSSSFVHRKELKNNSDFSEILKEIKEYSYGFIKNGYPVLLGGTVLTLSGEGGDAVATRLGRHLICALGFRMNDASGGRDNSYTAHGVERLYAHDDRYGPFVRLTLTPQKRVLVVDDNAVGDDTTSSQNHVFGIKLERYGKEELFIPDLLITVAPPKVRIDFPVAKEICDVISQVSKVLHDEIPAEANPDKPWREIERAAFKMAIESQWSIQLTDCSTIKSNIEVNDDWSFNGNPEKRALAFTPLPKHLWSCSLVEPTDSNSKHIEFLIDATEVPQGDIIVGVITHSEAGVSLYEKMHDDISSHKWETLKLNESKNPRSKFNSALYSVIRYFIRPNAAPAMTRIFGPASLPTRSLKPAETNQTADIVAAPVTATFTLDKPASKGTFAALDKHKTYLWVISADGDMIVGPVRPEVHEELGHPSLVDGAPARLGGELRPIDPNDDSTHTWEIDTKSGAYSQHVKFNGEDANAVQLLKLVRRMYLSDASELVRIASSE